MLRINLHRSASALLRLLPVLWFAVVQGQPRPAEGFAAGERLSAKMQLLAEYYRSPALRSLQYRYSLTSFALEGSRLRDGQRRKPQVGSGLQTSKFAAETYTHVREGQTAWGSASYTGARVIAPGMNECADYDIVAPYVTADTLGGDTGSESYAFAGGYMFRLNRRAGMGIEGSYSAKQESRTHDPRNLNTCSDLRLQSGFSYTIGAGDVSFSGSFRLYKQLHTLSFMNPLGTAFTFNMLGFDCMSARFIGNFNPKTYNGSGYGFAVGFVPRNRAGLYAACTWNYLGIEQLLSEGNQHVPLTFLSRSNLCVTTAYSGQPTSRLRLTAKISSRATRLRGAENIFGLNIGAFYPKVGVRKAYWCDTYAADINLLSEHIGRCMTTWLQPQLTLSYHAEHYADPRRRMEALNLLYGLRCGIDFVLPGTRWQIRLAGSLQKQNSLFGFADFGEIRVDPLIGSAQNFIRRTQEQVFRALSTAFFSSSGELRADYRLSHRLGLFAEIGGSFATFGSGRPASRINCSLGILFP